MSSKTQTLLDVLKAVAEPLETVALEDVGIIEKAGLSALQTLVNDLVDQINAKTGTTTTTTTS